MIEKIPQGPSQHIFLGENLIEIFILNITRNVLEKITRTYCMVTNKI